MGEWIDEENKRDFRNSKTKIDCFGYKNKKNMVAGGNQTPGLKDCLSQSTNIQDSSGRREMCKFGLDPKL